MERLILFNNKLNLLHIKFFFLIFKKILLLIHLKILFYRHDLQYTITQYNYTEIQNEVNRII